MQVLERRNNNDIDEAWLNLELSLQQERGNHTKFFPVYTQQSQHFYL